MDLYEYVKRTGRDYRKSVSETARVCPVGSPVSGRTEGCPFHEGPGNFSSRFWPKDTRGFVIITTNLGFASWRQVFGEPNMTAALLDRLTHKAHIIEFSWESYRLRQSLKGTDKRTGKHFQPENRG